jgi:hypothetical protein
MQSPAIHRNAPQGCASHKDSYLTADSTRGAESPLGGASVRPELIRRDEDFASAQMESHKPKGIPTPNAQGGVTAVRGRHGPQMTEDVSEITRTKR